MGARAYALARNVSPVKTGSGFLGEAYPGFRALDSSTNDESGAASSWTILCRPASGTRCFAGAALLRAPMIFLDGAEKTHTSKGGLCGAPARAYARARNVSPVKTGSGFLGEAYPGFRALDSSTNDESGAASPWAILCRPASGTRCFSLARLCCVPQ